MNILISTLVTNSNKSGLLTYLQNLIVGLQKVDLVNTYFILVNDEMKRQIKLSAPNFQFLDLSLPHYPRFIMRPSYFLWQNLLYNRIVKSHKIDILHLPNPVPLFKKLSIPCVVTIHDLAEFSNFRYKNIHRAFRKLVTKSVVKYTDRVITVSNFSKGEIVSTLNVKATKIDVTYLAAKLYNSKTVKISLTKNDPYFLHVGGTHLNKNIQRLINAFAEFNSNSKHRLILVGNTIEKPFRQYSSDYLKKNRIHFIGFVSDEELLELYRNAIALIYPSIYEGFGLPILEAMVHGLPVLTSNVTSMPEVAADAALYVNLSNNVELSYAMKRIVDDKQLRSRLIQKGFERAKVFSWDETARKTIKVYEKAHQSFHLQ